ncbi:hypothetical protein [Streptomyces sp. NBC_00212]|uniref:hypothetical protein n=1 Tax=Streptomyces sp. NBC_00212 TaxID=2975684 RepID=UPI003250048E
MRRERSIEEALARARVFEGEYTSQDREASRRRITQELGEFRWMQVLASPGTVRVRHAPSALHERAARDLRTLSQGIILDEDAARRIARFDTARDPGGALAFACLLVLADKEEGAQFWWQFAAGAGNATSALCLYLLHLRRGELRDAQYWARQLALLQSEPCQYMPVPHEVVTGTESPMSVTVHYELPTDNHALLETAVKDAVEELDIAQLDDFGPIPQPGPDLADQWAELVAS